MNKYCITAMAAAMILAVAGCSSDSASSSPASKAVTGKLTTPVFVKVDGKSQGADSEFKLGNTSNIYHATAFMDKGQHKIVLADAKDTCGTKFGPAASANLAFGTLAQLDKCAKNEFTINVVLKGNYDFTLDYTKDVPSVKVLRSTKKVEVKRQPPQIACDKWDGGPVTANVGKAFPNGTTVRDAYSGATAVVKGGKVTMTPAPESEGILLLEEAKS